MCKPVRQDRTIRAVPSKGDCILKDSPSPTVVADGALAALLRRDRLLGQRIYSFASRGPLAIAATVLGLSADEVVCFPMPILLLLTGLLALTPACELFGDVCMGVFLEHALKAAFRRARPVYARQSTFYCVPAEWYSFPSGHTLRAAFITRRMLGKNTLTLIYPILVGWARVAKGKHYPLDVAAGLLAGLFTAVTADYVGAEGWAALKYLAGSILTIEAIILLAVPKWRLKGTAVHVAIDLMWLASLRYGLGPSLAQVVGSLSAAFGFASRA